MVFPLEGTLKVQEDVECLACSLVLFVGGTGTVSLFSVDCDPPMHFRRVICGGLLSCPLSIDLL